MTFLYIMNLFFVKLGRCNYFKEGESVHTKRKRERKQKRSKYEKKRSKNKYKWQTSKKILAFAFAFVGSEQSFTSGTTVNKTTECKTVTKRSLTWRAWILRSCLHANVPNYLRGLNRLNRAWKPVVVTRGAFKRGPNTHSLPYGFLRYTRGNVR